MPGFITNEEKPPTLQRQLRLPRWTHATICMVVRPPARRAGAAEPGTNLTPVTRMRPSLRSFTPAALAVVLGYACSKQPAPSPAPTPAQNTANTAQRPPRTDSGSGENLLVARSVGQGQQL